MRDITLGETHDFKFNTSEPDTGAPITLAGSPAVAAYVDNSTTEITAGITLTVDFDGRTGMHNVRVVASGGNGFATGTTIALCLTAGTVDGVSVVGVKIAEFTIGRAQTANTTQFGGTALTQSGGRPEVNVTHAAGTAWGSGAITAASIAASALSLAKVATDLREALGLVTNGTLSGTHSSTTADLGASAPTNDITGQTVFFPDHDISRIITSYNTGTGVATFDSVAVTLANGNTWYLFATAPASGGGSAPSAAEIADAVWDEDITGHTTSNTAGQRIGRVPNAAAGGNGGLPTVDANNRIAGIAGTITTLDALDTAQDSQHSTTQGRLPAALVSGRIDASVGAMAANTMTAAAAASDLTTELQSGLATAANLATLQTTANNIETDTQDIQSRLPASLNNGCIQADVQRINNVEVVGAGTEGNEWRA